MEEEKRVTAAMAGRSARPIMSKYIRACEIIRERQHKGEFGAAIAERAIDNAVAEAREKAKVQFADIVNSEHHSIDSGK